MNKIQSWAKSRMDKIPNGQNPESDKLPNWTKSRMDKIPNGQNPEWTKSRIGQNPEWTKPRMDKIPNRQNAEWTKSRMDKIQNLIDFKDKVRINSVLTAGL